MKEILQLHQSGRLDEAAAAYRELLSREPGNVEALRLYAVLLRQRGDLGEASRLLDSAHALAPQRGDVLLELAGIRFIERNTEAAGSLATAALEHDPNLSGAHTLLGQLSLMQGRLDEAETRYRTALRADENDANALTGLGHVFLERNDGEGALRYLTHAAQLSPHEGLIQFALGRAFHVQGNLAFAEQALGNALRLRPELHAARLALGQLLTQQGRHAEAEAQYAVLSEAPAWRRAALAGLADSARGQGQFAHAETRYRECLALDPQQPLVMQALAWCLMQLGRPDDAVALFTGHLADYPADRTILGALAELQLNLGRTETSQELWHELIARHPEDGLAATRLALLCERNGEFADALSFAARAEKHYPRDAELGFVRIRAALREGDDARAVELLEALRTWPLNEGQARLAAHYRGLLHDRRDGDVAAAVAYWCDSQRELPVQIHGQEPLPPELTQRLAEPPGQAPADAAAPVFLLGLPGSEVERVASLLIEQPGLRVLRDRPMAPLRADDFAQPDFARYVAGLTSDDASGRRARYESERARHGASQARDVDWLIRWDARFLPLLRSAFPDATLIVVDRDPRDMLLSWLAFGWMPGFALTEPVAGAQWLQRAQAHIDAVQQSGLKVVRVNADALLADPVGQGVQLAQALGLAQLEAGRPQLALGGLKLGLPTGRWQAYAEVLGPAFAQFTERTA